MHVSIDQVMSFVKKSYKAGGNIILKALMTGEQLHSTNDWPMFLLICISTQIYPTTIFHKKDNEWMNE